MCYARLRTGIRSASPPHKAGYGGYDIENRFSVIASIAKQSILQHETTTEGWIAASLRSSQ